jgi:hypothetical protein
MLWHYPAASKQRRAQVDKSDFCIHSVDMTNLMPMLHVLRCQHVIVRTQKEYTYYIPAAELAAAVV